MEVGALRDVVTAVLGLATGALSGLFGVGGGVISQPGMRLLGLAPLTVIGTALPVIIPGAAVGARRYAREGLVRWSAALATIPAGIGAAVAGGLAAEHVPGDGHLLQLVTAGLLGLSSYRMVRGARPVAGDENEPLAETDAPEAAEVAPVAQALPERSLVPRYVAIGLLAGGLSGLLGIGGGVLMVPAFIALGGLPVKPAIATSLVCVGAFAVPGTVTHALQGHVDWRVAAALVVGVVPGARLGAALAIRATDRRLRLVVSSFLAVTAVVYAASELRSLLT
ncbi:MAG: sulfite exporter TauE/SafE family protein [Acidimicrobiia bacterium]|jgi:uncharacterized protein